MSITLLTPFGLLVALVGVVPVLALVRTRRRAQRARETLRLESHGDQPILAFGAIVLFATLLAVAVAQPAIRRNDERRIRTDAQAYYVFDTSRSMMASAGPKEPNRLDRAERLALRVRQQLESVPSGIATLTDRVLPDLFPTSDDEVFTATIEQSVGIDRPPPRSVDKVTTLFAAFDTMAGDNFFNPGIKRRLVFFFTDGESAPYDTAALTESFFPGSTAPVTQRGVPDFQPLQGKPKARKRVKSIPTRFVVMRLGNTRERIYWKGKALRAYQPDPNSKQIAETFVRAVRGQAFEEGKVDEVVAAARAALGDGPIEASGKTLRVVPLARWFILLSLVPLVGLLWRRNLV